MSSETQNIPGFTDVLTNMAYNPSTPFAPVPRFGKEEHKDEEDEGITVVFSKELTSTLAEIAEKHGLGDAANLVHTAVVVYTSMLGGVAEGYEKVVMINKDQTDCILVQLTKDDM